ncbi:MAG: hypothetical protein JNK15_23385 [Planctomycetes bacterium]|nr:hypothetical protein [Planctomycetota bacterium]
MRAHRFVWLLVPALVVVAGTIGHGGDADAVTPETPDVVEMDASSVAPAATALPFSPEVVVDVLAGERHARTTAQDAASTTAGRDTARNDEVRRIAVVDASGRPQRDVTLALQSVDVLRGQSRTLPLGTTDADGSLPFAHGRTGLVVAEAPGGRIGELWIGADTVEPMLVLQPTGAVVVLVADAAGRPVAGAEVVVSGGGCRQALRSDANGRAALPQAAPGPELELRVTSHGRRSVARIDAGRPVGRTFEHVVVLADECAQVHTALVDEQGRPLPHTTIRCTFADGTSTRASSDEFGRLCIDLPPTIANDPGTLHCERLDHRGGLVGTSVTTTLPPAAGRVHAVAPLCLPAGSLAHDAPRSGFEFATGRTRVSSRS